MERIAGCNREEFLKFIDTYPLGNLVPRKQIDNQIRNINKYLEQFLPPGSATVEEIGPSSEKADDFIRLLEETYVKRQAKQEKNNM